MLKLNNKMVIAVVILVGGIITYLSMSQMTPTVEKQIQPKTIPEVTVQRIKAGPFNPVVRVFGQVSTYQNSDIKADVSAKVEHVLVVVGQSVVKGQTLVQLDDKETKNALKQAAAEVTKLQAQLTLSDAKLAKENTLLGIDQNILQVYKKELLQQEALYKAKHTSKEALAHAQKAYQQQQVVVKKHEHDIRINLLEKERLANKLRKAKLRENAAQLTNQRTTLKAPFKGVIGEVDASVGEYVQTGVKLLTLINQDAFEVGVQISPKMAAIFKEELSQGVRISAKSSVFGKQILSTLTSVSSQISSGILSPKAIFTVVSGNAALSLGQSLALDVTLPIKEDIFVVPKSALYRDEIVYRIKKNRLQAIPVMRYGETAMSDQSRYQLIFSDVFNVGDTILISRLPNPIAGMKVKVKNKPQPALKSQPGAMVPANEATR